jgi:hypothetical protein
MGYLAAEKNGEGVETWGLFGHGGFPKHLLLVSRLGKQVGDGCSVDVLNCHMGRVMMWPCGLGVELGTGSVVSRLLSCHHRPNDGSQKTRLRLTEIGCLRLTAVHFSENIVQAFAFSGSSSNLFRDGQGFSRSVGMCANECVFGLHGTW